MADRTVRAIFEARVSGAKRDMLSFGKDVADTGKKVDVLSKDLKTLGAAKVKPSVDVQIDEAKKRLSALTLQLADLKKMDASPEVTADIEKAKAQIADVRREIKDLNSTKAEVRVNAAVSDAQKRIKEITLQLGELRTLEVTPEVTADITAARKSLALARTELRDLNGAKAQMKVTADTGDAKKAIDGLADDVGEAGAEGGEDAGEGIVTGILDALRTIPIAGAVIGVGVAIAGGILLGIQQGLAIEAERDLFGAQTGLDEVTSARFGRAAGEAYANAWGDSVAANLDTARRAMQAGIIDSEATDAEIENVIAKLQGLNDLFEYDIASSVRGVGNLMRTGLVKDADQAFDLIVSASQKVSSDDLLDTLTEYSNQFVTLGITGEQAFGLIVQGAQAGARDTDKVGDSLKELGLRIREGLDPARDALKDLGLDVDDTIEAFTRGGPDAARAIDDVFDALRALEAKGGNTQAVIAALFGGPGEDLGAALYALDIDGVTEALGGVDGAAGAADRALKTLTDNTATKMEEAKRNVELAMDGIKGALAEAFGDEIDGAAVWVSKNRAPLMQFFLDVINGTIDMAEAFALFGVEALFTISELANGLADFIESIPFVDDAMADALRNVGDSAGAAAVRLGTDVPAALDEVRNKANAWAAPELLKAKLHDATVAMTEDLDALSAKFKAVAADGVTIRINGDTVNAEEALALLVENIDAETGTVIIEGDPVPAEDALERIIELIEAGDADLSVGADTDPADVEVRRLEDRIGQSGATVEVDADTAGANKEIDYAARNRRATISVGYVLSSTGDRLVGNHEGGYTGRALPGLYTGGMVPGRDPGYDNVLWPLNSGGRTLTQPLAGGEYVVNSKDSAYWAPILEWMNNGGRPGAQSISETNNSPVNIIGGTFGPTLDDVERAAAARRRRDSLSPSKAGG